MEGRLEVGLCGPDGSKWGMLGVWRQNSVSFLLPATPEYFAFLTKTVAALIARKHTYAHIYRQ